MGMFGLVALFLVIIWLIGAVLNIVGGMIHILLFAAVGLFLYRYFTKNTIY